MLRRERIFARLREGWAYADIAQAEGLSSKRISQIVSEALQKRTLDSVPDHAMLQLARLEPALKLAAGALAEGDVGAISPYLKLLDRLDRYQKPLAAVVVYDDKARERLIAKMDRIIARVHAEKARKAAKAASMDAARLPPASVGGHAADEAAGEGASQTGNNETLVAGRALPVALALRAVPRPEAGSRRIARGRQASFPVKPLAERGRGPQDAASVEGACRAKRPRLGVGKQFGFRPKLLKS